ncbi:MAG: hypothetical protein Q8942_14870 [Bacillota bacterium]|nr:hypothetical protein [Bacillota bacterium]
MTNSIQTKYGIINGISTCDFYENGQIKEFALDTYNEISTEFGILAAQYNDSNLRKKFTKSLSFYKNGSLKSIALNEQTKIKTPAGIFPAELLVFYESGAIKRLFPLNGKITGYWSEEDEYELAPILFLNLSFGKIKTKVISIYFYETGEIKGITLWPKDQLKVLTPAGLVTVRIGITFYPDGSIKSMEPNIPVSVNTPIGKLEAFNSSAIGIHGDSNSLCFSSNGRLKSLMTSTDKVIVRDNTGKVISYEPSLKPNMFDLGKMELHPLNIEFFDNKVRFENIHEHEIENCSFQISQSSAILGVSGCGDCSSCNSCSPVSGKAFYKSN